MIFNNMQLISVGTYWTRQWLFTITLKKYSAYTQICEQDHISFKLINLVNEFEFFKAQSDLSNFPSGKYSNKQD